MATQRRLGRQNSISNEKTPPLTAQENPPDGSARTAWGLRGYTRGCARAHPPARQKSPGRFYPNHPGAPIGFIKLGVPRGPASTPRLGLSRQHITHRPVQGSKTTDRKGGLVTDRKVWPKRNNAHSSATSAHLSDRSVRFDSSRLRTTSPIRRPGPKHYFRLRPRVSDLGSQEPCSPLFSDRRT